MPSPSRRWRCASTRYDATPARQRCSSAQRPRPPRTWTSPPTTVGRGRAQATTAKHNAATTDHQRHPRRVARPSRFATAQQAAAYAGLAPREDGSGTSVEKRTRRSKAGNARLRKALHLPALTAVRFDPLVAAFHDRFVAAGKPKRAAVGAGTRKLLMIGYGVLKSRTQFDPTRASKMTP